ncbi:MAG: prolyl-tRNA synthetase associated domain-containing protein [Rikenellaceae bacterium]
MDKIGKVLQFLESLEIPYTLYRHPPLSTIEIALEYWRDIPGAHCKNLFFRNHKGDRHYLVIFECHQELNIHDLEKRLKQGKLSFASPERMEKYLGLKPGSVSPFGLINDQEHHVRLFIDKNLEKQELLCFHPNDNTASLLIKTTDFRKFLDFCTNEYIFQEMIQTKKEI